MLPSALTLPVLGILALTSTAAGEATSRTPRTVEAQPEGSAALTQARAVATSTVTTSTGSVVAGRTARREMPDYDGLDEPPPSAGEIALWVPRVVFFPAWLVSEYLVRRPLRWLTVTAEQNQWPKLILDFFTFGEDRRAGFYPTALVDFGFRPSIGIYTFWDKLGIDAHSTRLYAAYGGRAWYAVRVNDRFVFNERSRIGLTLGASRRPDYRFEGTGPLPIEDLLGRYRMDRLEGVVLFESLFGEAGRFSAFAGSRRVIFNEGTCCDDPSLDDLIEQGVIAPPVGHQTDYALWEHGFAIAWDSRRPRPAPGHGTRLELMATQAWDINGSLKSPWISYGGALGGYLDLTGHNRVLSLFVSARLIEPIDGDGVVPFTELLTMGSSGEMPGFRPGTLLGESRATAQLEYRWPIWAFFDGAAHVAVGNVFDHRFDGFTWENLRMSFGLGIRTVGRPDHAFNMLAAMGTDTFGRGTSVNTFRFTIGTTRGF